MYETCQLGQYSLMNAVDLFGLGLQTYCGRLYKKAKENPQSVAQPTGVYNKRDEAERKKGKRKSIGQCSEHQRDVILSHSVPAFWPSKCSKI